MPLAARTGSEVALWNLIRYATASGWQAGVVSREEGDLLKELPPEVPVFVYYRLNLLRRTLFSARRRLGGQADDRFLKAVNERFKPDIWYVNTILQPDVVIQSARRQIPCVLHTHELEQILERVQETELNALIQTPRLVVACSDAARNVFKTLGRSDRVEVCYETIDSERIKWSDDRSVELRKSLGVTDGTFIWAMTGTLDANKNPVRFAEIAARMVESTPDVHFLWIGKGDSAYAAFARARARALRVDGKVSFVGEQTDDYYNYLNAANGVVITSFKESFSLTAAEAAYLGKPVGSFNCGGVKEIISDRMGVVIDSWNNDDLIRAMEGVMCGEIPFDPLVSRERVKEFSLEVQGARWKGFLQEYFGQ